MISIPAVLVLDDVSRYGGIRAFIVVFPGSLEGLRFVWVAQIYEN